MSAILDDVFYISEFSVLVRIEVSCHKLLPKLLIWRSLYRSFMTIALNLSVLVSVRDDAIFGIDLLGYLTTIDNHDKVSPLLVIPGVVPKFDFADVGAYEIDGCVIKFIDHEIMLST